MATDAVVKQVVEAVDQFGRTEMERTVVLLSVQAEAINNEVTDGDHDTYQDALNYVIERGLKEIERQRDSSKKQETIRLKAKAMGKFESILARSPKLADNRDQLVAVVKATMSPSELATLQPTFQMFGIKL